MEATAGAVHHGARAVRGRCADAVGDSGARGGPAWAGGRLPVGLPAGWAGSSGPELGGGARRLGGGGRSGAYAGMGVLHAARDLGADADRRVAVGDRLPPLGEPTDSVRV